MVDLCVHQTNGPMEEEWTSERLTHALVHMLHMLHMLANASDNLLMAPPPHRLPPPLTFSIETSNALLEVMRYIADFANDVHRIICTRSCNILVTCILH